LTRDVAESDIDQDVGLLHDENVAQGILGECNCAFAILRSVLCGFIHDSMEDDTFACGISAESARSTYEAARRLGIKASGTAHVGAPWHEWDHVNLLPADKAAQYGSAAAYHAMRPLKAYSYQVVSMRL
jgi:hypothetical protein